MQGYFCLEKLIHFCSFPMPFSFIFSQIFFAKTDGFWRYFNKFIAFNKFHCLCFILGATYGFPHYGACAPPPSPSHAYGWEPTRPNLRLCSPFPMPFSFVFGQIFFAKTDGFWRYFHKFVAFNKFHCLCFILGATYGFPHYGACAPPPSPSHAYGWEPTRPNLRLCSPFPMPFSFVFGQIFFAKTDGFWRYFHKFVAFNKFHCLFKA